MSPLNGDIILKRKQCALWLRPELHTRGKYNHDYVYVELFQWRFCSYVEMNKSLRWPDLTRHWVTTTSWFCLVLHVWQLLTTLQSAMIATFWRFVESAQWQTHVVVTETSIMTITDGKLETEMLDCSDERIGRFLTPFMFPREKIYSKKITLLLPHQLWNWKIQMVNKTGAFRGTANKPGTESTQGHFSRFDIFY